MTAITHFCSSTYHKNEGLEHSARPENVESVQNASVKTGAARQKASDSGFIRLLWQYVYYGVAQIDLPNQLVHFGALN